MAFFTADQPYYDFVTPDLWGDRVNLWQGFTFVSTGAGGVTLVKYWMNKVWDPGGPQWVYWETPNAPDPTGASYPDPFATGFGGCSNYRVAWTDVR
jgi:hypothetical protein